MNSLVSRIIHRKPSNLLFIAAVVLLNVTHSWALQPTVSNVTAMQRAGTKEVEIRYKLVVHGGGRAHVTVTASRDNGSSYEEVPLTQLSGDFGPYQLGAFGPRELVLKNNKTIIWDLEGSNWDQAVFSQVKVRVTATSVSVPAEMVLVEGGILETESSFDDLYGTVLESFYLSATETRWDDWQSVRTWAAVNGYDIGSIGSGCADDHPVHDLNWYDVVKWCNAKSEMEGLTPVYTVESGIYRSGHIDDVTMSTTANGYRLPMEAEWVYAARGGNLAIQYVYNEYAGGNDPTEVAWYDRHSVGVECEIWGENGTWPVGQKLPNELELYDMSGNVWEWCWDSYIMFDRIHRRSRGGGFDFTYSGSRIANRTFFYAPEERRVFFGFRLARSSVN